jgi:hypothetical protein
MIKRWLYTGIALTLLNGCQAPCPYVVHDIVILPTQAPALISRQQVHTDKNLSDSCQLTCFSFKRQGARYPITDHSHTMYVHGFTQVVGKVDAQNICRPRDYGSKDISKLKVFNALCRLTIPSCRDNCWAGGNP